MVPRVPDPRLAVIVRGLRDGLTVAGLLFGAYLFGVIAPAAGTFGFDARSYWDYTMADPYALSHGSLGSFTRRYARSACEREQ